MTANPGLETITATTWVYELLSTDAALAAAIGVDLDHMEDQIGEAVAPSDSDPTKPWVVWTIQDSMDVKVVGNIQVMARTRFQVRCTVRGNSYNPLIPVYQRVHTLLEGATFQELAQDDGFVLTCQRVSGVQFPEDDQGVQYRHLGGLYESFIQ